MKIEHIEVINLLFNYPPENHLRYSGGVITGRLTSLVQVTTDNGFLGIGAAYSHPKLVEQIVEEHLAPILIGEDPTDVERLWQKMYRATRWYGRKGAAMSALGALDIAFWDLRGKALGKSVYSLLGGNDENPRVRIYASALLWNDGLDDLAAEAAGYIDQGFRRVKMRLGKSEEYDIAAVQAVRKAIGPNNDVIIDASMNYSLEVAQRMGDFFAKENVFWYEEPFEPEAIDDYVALRKGSKVPIAAGENEFGLQGFRELLVAGAVDIVQPDACRAGGISEVYKVGQLAVKYNARVGTHTWSDAVALVANMHTVAALPNGLSVEMDRTGNPFIDNLLIEPIQVRDGYAQLPTAPGLGITVNPRTISDLRLAHDSPIPDGAYSDMSFGKAYDVTRAPYQTLAPRS
jgi:L-alanine-DL-glutamate epimerase-like enolase superfamily enzyme